MRTSYGIARYQASEGDLLAAGRVARAARGCLFLSGRSSTAVACLGAAFGEEIVRACAESGLATMAADWGGGVTWGNDTATARMETGRVYQQSAQGAAADKAVVCGVSMGTITALRYAMANPTKVAAVALVLPVPDVQGMYDDNVGGFQAEIGTAYGARPSNAQNPSSNPGSFAGIPIRMWYSTDDTTARPTPALAFAAATGAEVTSLGAVGHTFANASLPGEVASFLRAYAA